MKRVTDRTKIVRERTKIVKERTRLYRGERRKSGRERRGYETKIITPSIAWRRGVERGSSQRSPLKGRERAIVSQTNIGTVSSRCNIY